ncbi:MAG TPA: phosphate ABC transporter substrate-binding protein [Anaeromyxobacteraceae bacterium]|nr:phosphate ABC transporter substrate-binding protein [Anaeromyxobacteraceae bacterium]
MKRSLLLAVALLAPAISLAGTTTVKGSDTMVILAQRWAEAWMKQQPAKKVQVTGGGSGTGIAALINGTTDVADASRAMKPDERAKVKAAAGVDAFETIVARDGVAIYVNAANPVKSLTVEQLRGIYLGDVTNWKQVGGPDARIVLYSRENSSGTYVFVKEHVLKNEDFAPEAQTLPGTAAVVNAVSKEKGGIGYGGGAYAKGVKELLIEGVAPTKENVLSGKYPLSRPLFVYTKGAPKGEVKEYVDFCLSPAGQKIVADVGYFPIK